MKFDRGQALHTCAIIFDAVREAGNDPLEAAPRAEALLMTAALAWDSWSPERDEELHQLVEASGARLAPKGFRCLPDMP